MSEAGRVCAKCVFWVPRDLGGSQTPGRCRARLLDAPDPRQGFMTRADFVCGQWCGHATTPDAAE